LRFLFKKENALDESGHFLLGGQCHNPSTGRLVVVILNTPKMRVFNVDRRGKKMLPLIKNLTVFWPLKAL
jgi:hypothetical protein